MWDNMYVSRTPNTIIYQYQFAEKPLQRDSCTCNFIRTKVTTVNISFVIGVLETRNVGSFKLNRLNRYVFSNRQKTTLQLG